MPKPPSSKEKAVFDACTKNVYEWEQDGIPVKATNPRLEGKVFVIDVEIGGVVEDFRFVNPPPVSIEELVSPELKHHEALR